MLGMGFLYWFHFFTNKKGLAIWASKIGAKDIIILEGVGA
jgi:hypothetical protein